MSSSATKKRAAKTAAVYLVVALLCAIFGTVYELFSFGVFSMFMIFCFMPPLILGSLPFFAIYLFGKGMPCRLAFNLYNSGIATITVGFIFRGVIEIYGTTNRLSHIYSLSGALFVAASLIVYIIDITRNKKTIEKQS
ncbi:MAG: hypothetical protein IKQ18_03805 [Clostridia bacterium]|nr:hypothetical protein [Clostridia bacterium]